MEIPELPEPTPERPRLAGLQARTHLLDERCLVPGPVDQGQTGEQCLVDDAPVPQNGVRGRRGRPFLVQDGELGAERCQRDRLDRVSGAAGLGLVPQGEDRAWRRRRVSYGGPC